LSIDRMFSHCATQSAVKPNCPAWNRTQLASWLRTAKRAEVQTTTSVMAAVELLARNDDNRMGTRLGKVGKVDLAGLDQGALLARSPALRKATARIAL